MVTEPNPVSEGVGYDPTLPVIMVVPVLVMPEYARTAKGVAVPRVGAVAAKAFGSAPYPPSIPATSRAATANVIMLFFGKALSVSVFRRNSEWQRRICLCNVV
jgi:hypothetical protein